MLLILSSMCNGSQLLLCSAVLSRHSCLQACRAADSCLRLHRTPPRIILAAFDLVTTYFHAELPTPKRPRCLFLELRETKFEPEAAFTLRRTLCLFKHKPDLGANAVSCLESVKFKRPRLTCQAMRLCKWPAYIADSTCRRDLAVVANVDFASACKRSMCPMVTLPR